MSTYLPTPTKAISTPALNTRILPLRISNHSQQFPRARTKRSRDFLHKSSLLPIILLAACEPLPLRWLALEEIWDENESVQSCCEKISALEGLGGESEDIVDVDDGFG
jgi:hypothetical protein